MKITILGCGSSGGVPLIGGNWGACNPDNPKNRRRRASVLVQEQDYNLLIDCGPDLREQLIDAKVSRIDAVLMTHAHADHCLGLDDLRRLYWINDNTPIPFYGDAATLEELTTRFPYAFRPFRDYPEKLGALASQVLKIGRPYALGPLRVLPFAQVHGEGMSVGFRIGDFAYSVDASDMPETAFAALSGVRTWVVDCLQREAHHAHSYLPQTLGWIERLKPQQAILTHMSPSLDYDALRAECPPGVVPAYDGMTFEV